jgi:hypothetical protein
MSTSGFVSISARNVLQADSPSPVAAAVEVDGNGPASAVVVSGGNGQGANYIGPMTIMDGGGYPATAIENATKSPLSMGQEGIMNGHVVGKVDDVDRANPPSVVRFANIAPANPGGPSFCTGGSYTTGIDDPYGGTGAFRAACASGTGVMRLHGSGFEAISVGEGFAVKIWVRASTANGFSAGFYGGVIGMGFAGGTGTPSFTGGANIGFSPYMNQTAAWQVVWGVGIVSNAGTSSQEVIIDLGVDSTHGPLDFYAPEIVVLPNTIPANEQYEIAQNLPFYPPACSVGQQCNMQGYAQTIIPSSSTITYTAIAAQTCQDQTISVTGATTVESVTATPGASLGNANLSWSAWVSAANTVSVRVCNPTSGSITPSAVTWRARVIQ